MTASKEDSAMVFECLLEEALGTLCQYWSDMGHSDNAIVRFDVRKKALFTMLARTMSVMVPDKNIRWDIVNRSDRPFLAREIYCDSLTYDPSTKTLTKP